MAPPTSRPEHHINLNYLPQLTPNQPRSGSSTAATSPIEPPTAANNVRYPLGNGNSMAAIGNATATARMGAGSPSHDYGGRLFSKRYVHPHVILARHHLTEIHH